MKIYVISRALKIYIHLSGTVCSPHPLHVIKKLVFEPHEPILNVPVSLGHKWRLKTHACLHHHHISPQLPTPLSLCSVDHSRRWRRLLSSFSAVEHGSDNQSIRLLSWSGNQSKWEPLSRAVLSVRLCLIYLHLLRCVNAWMWAWSIVCFLEERDLELEDESWE